jgi:hypothetical protein
MEDGFRILVSDFYASCGEVQKRTAEYRITNKERRRKQKKGFISSFEIPWSPFTGLWLAGAAEGG